VNSLLQYLAENRILLTGTDTGNTDGKFSFLNAQGNIESFVIPSIIAKAPSSKVKLNGVSQKEGIAPEKFLHVHITSESLSNENTNSYWYVGSYAKDKDERQEPKIIIDDDTQEKRSQQKFSNDIHVIVLLSGLAVAAMKYGYQDGEVKVPYSGGLPIREFKEVGEEKALAALRGKHEVEFIDGPYEGKKIIINIVEGNIYAEGVANTLAISYDIVNGELVETEMGKKVGENFALADLGAGTTDLVIFDENGINKDLSTNTYVGTNRYIDQMMDQIRNLEVFKPIYEAGGDKVGPYKTREHFMSEVVEPEILKLVDDENHKLSFKAKWMFVKDVDVTEIVLDTIEKYGKQQYQDLMKFWSKAVNVDEFVVVGGGLLFGYPVFKNYKNQFIFPDNIKEVQFFTSKSYLIANYLVHVQKVQNQQLAVD
jgi:plasmid segregation protein ParM